MLSSNLVKTLHITALLALSAAVLGAGDSVLLDTMNQELERNYQALKQKADPAPYFMAYEVTDLDTPGPEEMKELIASLSPAERKLLRDPNFISEDEADLIMSDRGFNEPELTISLDELLKENGMTRRGKRA